VKGGGGGASEGRRWGGEGVPACTGRNITRRDDMNGMSEIAQWRNAGSPVGSERPYVITTATGIKPGMRVLRKGA
jgi:hypothetical protein